VPREGRLDGVVEAEGGAGGGGAEGGGAALGGGADAERAVPAADEPPSRRAGWEGYPGGGRPPEGVAMA